MTTQKTKLILFRSTEASWMNVKPSRLRDLIDQRCKALILSNFQSDFFKTILSEAVTFYHVHAQDAIISSEIPHFGTKGQICAR